MNRAAGEVAAGPRPRRGGAAGGGLLIATAGAAPAHTAGPGAPAGGHPSTVSAGSPARAGGGISLKITADHLPYYEAELHSVVITSYQR